MVTPYVLLSSEDLSHPALLANALGRIKSFSNPYLLMANGQELDPNSSTPPPAQLDSGSLSTLIRQAGPILIEDRSPPSPFPSSSSPSLVRVMMCEREVLQVLDGPSTPDLVHFALLAVEALQTDGLLILNLRRNGSVPLP